MSLVKPPNITMPKTLAAEPSSQYATDFELVRGQDEALGSLEALAWVLEVDAPILYPNAAKGDDGDGDDPGDCAELCLLRAVGFCCLKACRKGVWRGERA